MRKIILLFFIIAFFAACRKALDVERRMYFEQVNWVDKGGVKDPMVGPAPMTLELSPNGFAGLYPGSGDIVWQGRYRIKGKKIKVDINDMEMKYEFTILSDSEITGPRGEVLHLKDDND